MAKKAGLQVTPKANNLPATDDLEARMREHAGEGLDTIGAGDLLIPRLTILQGMSPQIAQGRPEFDPNARAGQIYDVGMKECYPDGIVVVIAYSTKVWNEWAPRATQRGIVQRHENPLVLQNCRPGENNAPTLPNGNTITETAEFYVLNLSARGRKSFIPMASTQLKESRRINNYVSEEIEDSQGNIYRPPIYYRTYTFTTTSTSNAKGTWFLWKVERGQKLSEVAGGARLFDEVRAFREMLIKGTVKGDMSEGGASTDVPWENEQPRQQYRRNEGPL